MTETSPSLQGILTDEEMADIERVGSKPPAAAIRLNTLKIDLDAARQTWPEEYGWQIEPVPFCLAGWRFAGPPRGLSRTLEYRMGYYYIQDMASMLPAELFSPLGVSPLILDMAAAPGGKTTHLVCKSGDRGLLLANDISGGRVGMLRSNLRRWGALSSVVANLPGERLGRRLPEMFDCVLLDAPCSGETLRAESGSRRRRVSAKERRSLHDRQIRLIESAFTAAKVGGEIVYATCTSAPEEDEAVLDDFLRAHSAAAEIIRPAHLADLPGGLGGIAGRDFDRRVAGAIRLWPHQQDTISFFAALIRKRDSVKAPDDSHAAARGAHGARTGFERLPPGDAARIAAALREGYGFDLAALVEDRALEIWQAGRLCHAIPRRLETALAGLPVKAAGMLIGAVSEDGFTPSHELVARFADQFTRGRVQIADEQVSAWLGGAEIRGMAVPGDRQGRMVLLEDSRGRFLGRGKASAGRIRNLLPPGF